MFVRYIYKSSSYGLLLVVPKKRLSKRMQESVVAYHMPRESTAICAFSRSPVSTVMVLMYHISRQSMTADSSESLTNAQISWKAATDHPL